MATVSVASILDRANILLNDPGFIRWPKQELLNYYNDAAKAIVLVRPDAHTKHVDFSCAAGTKQALPVDALRLIDVVRNFNGSVIRYVPRKALDDSYPEWHTSATATKVSAFTYDERDPKVFFLYPGPAAAVKVDVVYSVAPQSKTLAEVEDENTPAIADLDDIYINPLIDFIMYRAFLKDSEYAANANRSQGHYQAFLQQLGDKTTVDSNQEQRKTAQFVGSTGR